MRITYCFITGKTHAGLAKLGVGGPPDSLYSFLSSSRREGGGAMAVPVAVNQHIPALVCVCDYIIIVTSASFKNIN